MNSKIFWCIWILSNVFASLERTPHTVRNSGGIDGIRCPVEHCSVLSWAEGSSLDVFFACHWTHPFWMKSYVWWNYHIERTHFRIVLFRHWINAIFRRMHSFFIFKRIHFHWTHTSERIHCIHDGPNACSTVPTFINPGHTAQCTHAQLNLKSKNAKKNHCIHILAKLSA